MNAKAARDGGKTAHEGSLQLLSYGPLEMVL